MATTKLEQNKKAQIVVRLTETQNHYLDEICEHFKTTKSKYIRQIIDNNINTWVLVNELGEERLRKIIPSLGDK